MSCRQNECYLRKPIKIAELQVMLEKWMKLRG